MEDRTGKAWRWTLASLWTVLFLYLLVAFNPSNFPLVSLASSWSCKLGLPPHTLFKVGHVCGYMLWVFLWCGVLSGGYRAPLPKYAWIWLPIGIFVLAAVPEWLQSFNPKRHPAWLDVGYNTAGALIGLGIRQLAVRKKPEPQAAR